MRKGVGKQMNLQQLRYVICITEQGSFNKASEMLYVSQPALTKAVKELEKEIGIQIFRRGGHGVSLTADGTEFIAYARSVCMQMEAILERYGQGGVVKKKFGVSTQHYSFATKAFVETVRDIDMSEYEFAIRETKTREVIEDVGSMKSEIGILYMSDFNRAVISKILKGNNISFTKLIDCQAYVYLWKGHPLAGQDKITYAQLSKYPCLAFEQGENNSFYFSEEILSTNEYPQIIRTNDRATMLNLMVGLNGYTLCPGIICEELNGSDNLVIPYAGDESNPNSVMEIGYIKKEDTVLSKVGRRYIEELKKYLELNVKI